MSAMVVDFLAGAITLGFFVAAGFFLRFWRRTHDRLFLAFGAAFVLLAMNQGFAAFLGAGDERTPYTYLLRVLGFVLILYAIIDKNVSSSRGPRQQKSAPKGIAHE